MKQRLTSSNSGFTLVEIMIVVAIIALLAAIAVPNFLRSRRRSQATQILQDMRLIDAAVDQYAIETNKPPEFLANWSDIQQYIKSGSRLHTSGCNDILGNVFGSERADGSGQVPSQFYVDGVVHFQQATYNALSSVAPMGFWSPFRVH
ncbi:MAG: hypothetical protein RL088_2579 [Verrucomicrobiota bacterium]|jgi:prepilin-type N-terminal cleavage/methylation domain-containing protein